MNPRTTDLIPLDECGYFNAPTLPGDEKHIDRVLDTVPMPTITTASGQQLSLTYPSWRLIDRDDIALALSRICRFGGHTTRFYSVAQHSILVSEIVPSEDALAGLLHDATEAYIGDMVSPLKALLPAFKVIEERIWQAIAQRFGVEPVLPASVKHADLQLLATERRDLLPASQPWPCLEGIEPLADPIEPWSSDLAAIAWNLRLEELLGERELREVQA